MSSNFDRKPPPIDVLISIGNSCRTRFQIEEFVSTVRQNYIKSWPKSNYFDNLLWGGVAGAANVIARGFKLTPADIEIVQYVENKFVPKDKFSNHLFLHGFGLKWPNDNDYKTVITKLHKNMDATIRKYNHLGKKTDAFLRSNLSVALVYYGTASDNEWTELKKTLVNQYGKEITVINILKRPHQVPTTVEGIYAAFINDESDEPEDDWKGCTESWRSAFASLDCIKTAQYLRLRAMN